MPDHGEVPMTEPCYKWMHSRLWLCLILYWLVSMTVAGLIARAEVGWIIMCMLIVIIVCMVTERGRWRPWKRVLFVPLAWIAQPLLSIPVLFTVGFFLLSLGREGLIDRAVTFISSLPLVLFAMRQSRLFVSCSVEAPQTMDNRNALAPRPPAS